MGRNMYMRQGLGHSVSKNSNEIFDVKKSIKNLESKLDEILRVLNSKELAFDLAKNNQMMEDEKRAIDYVLNGGFNNTLNDESKKEITQNKEDSKAESREMEQGGLMPPKTDWERVRLSRKEMNSIVNDIKSGKVDFKSVTIKKDLTTLQDFTKAFSHIENPKNYNGPFIANVVFSKSEMDILKNHHYFKDMVNSMVDEKYIVVRFYDIIASEGFKNSYAGIHFNALTGKLRLDRIFGEKNELQDYQEGLIREYLKIVNVEL